MVPITSKPITARLAVATSSVTFSNPSPFNLITTHSMKKGDVLAVARVAGIMAAKKTSDLIPLCHPGLNITGVDVLIDLVGPDHTKDDDDGRFGRAVITATVSCEGKTGVEMEALTAATGAALTVFDMCKAVDKQMVIGGGRVIRKEGGKSGSWSLKEKTKDAEWTKRLKQADQKWEGS